jgi:hypothetical protein
MTKLFIVLVVIIAYTLFEIRRIAAARRACRSLWGPASAHSLALRMIACSVSAGLAFVFLTLAVFSPDGDHGAKARSGQGTDLAIVLDVSNSMALSDVAPSRLLRAKAQIHAVLESPGDRRCALILCKGSAETVFPLSSDTLSLLDFVDECGPESLTAPGTNLAAGVDKASAALDDQSLSRKIIWIVSDGESLQGNLPERVALAAKKGARVFALGVGSLAGAPLDKKVSGKNAGRSAKNPAALQAAARIGHGFYADEDDGAALGLLRARLLDEHESRFFSGHKKQEWPASALYAALSLAAFAFSLLVRHVKPPSFWRALGLFGMALSLSACGNSLAILRNERALSSIRHGNYESATALLLEQRVQSSPAANQTRNYNLALCYAALGQNDLAEELLLPLADSKSARLASNASYNLGCLYFAEARWRDAWLAFKTSLSRLPNRSDARINLELAYANIKKEETSHARQQSELELTSGNLPHPEEFDYVRQNQRDTYRNSQQKPEEENAEDY